MSAGPGTLRNYGADLCPACRVRLKARASAMCSECRTLVRRAQWKSADAGRDARVIAMRDGLGMSFGAIGRELGVTPMRASQVYRRALQRREGD